MVLLGGAVEDLRIRHLQVRLAAGVGSTSRRVGPYGLPRRFSAPLAANFIASDSFRFKYHNFMRCAETVGSLGSPWPGSRNANFWTEKLRQYPSVMGFLCSSGTPDLSVKTFILQQLCSLHDDLKLRSEARGVDAGLSVCRRRPSRA